MNINLIPPLVLDAVRKREKFTDEEIVHLSPRELFDEYCSWNGLLNWGDSLWDTMDQLQKVQPAPGAVVVTLNNGIFQDALSSFPVSVAVVDYDDSADLEEQIMIPQSDGTDDQAAVARVVSVEVNEVRTREILEAIEEGRPALSMKP